MAGAASYLGARLAKTRRAERAALSVRAKPTNGAQWTIVSTISSRLRPTLSPIPMWYSSCGSQPPSGQGRDRDELTPTEVEVRQRIDVPVAELDGVAREVRRDVPQPF